MPIKSLPSSIHSSYIRTFREQAYWKKKYLVYNKSGGRLSGWAQCAQSVGEGAVLLAYDDALGRCDVRNLVRREILLELDVRLLRHLPHERVHLVLRRRHHRRGAHRVFHVRGLYVEV